MNHIIKTLKCFLLIVTIVSGYIAMISLLTIWLRFTWNVIRFWWNIGG